jgi:class 3 adenylate cyclase
VAADALKRNFDEADSREEIDLGTVETVRLGSVVVGRETLQPGWRWSTHVKPIVGTEWCEFHHVGVQISGRFVFRMSDGSSVELVPGDVYDIPPGHDGSVAGEEPSVQIDFQGVTGWAMPAVGRRVLTTVLFTDIADSTAAAERMGDRRWTMLMAQHTEDVRHQLSTFGGHEVKSTGDGFLATFDRPASAVQAAAAITASALRLGLGVRSGVHTGEVELADDDLRGVTVHLAARVMDQAAPGEVLVSATTHDLVGGAGLAFTEKGTFELKGITGARRLYRLESTG